MQVVDYKGDTYPYFQTIGNASQFAIPFAKHVCSGSGYDIGCMKKEWAFPGATPIDLDFDDPWHADELPPTQVDYIFSSHCLEHVPDWVATMDYWYKCIRDGGTLFLYLPDYSQKYWRPWNNRRHKHCLKPEFIRDYMVDKGYNNVFVSGVDLNNAFMAYGGEMKKIAVSTWVTDDYVDYIGLDELRNSFKYFHPDVDFFVFDTKATKEAMEKDPWLNNVWMMPPSCLPFVEDYDMVVHIDGDCVVTGPMTELFESEEDVIGVRNNNSLDKASAHDFGITITHLPPFGNGQQIPIQGFINAGLIASNNKQFWYDWHELNREAKRIKDEVNPYAHGIGDEQDTLNQIFHSGKYSTKIIDAMGTNVSYGISNHWGKNDNHWESWSEIYVKDDALYLDDPKTGVPMCLKVMHQAGGAAAAKLNKEHGGLREWMKTVIAEEPLQYINKVTP